MLTLADSSVDVRGSRLDNWEVFEHWTRGCARGRRRVRKCIGHHQVALVVSVEQLSNAVQLDLATAANSATFTGRPEDGARSVSLLLHADHHLANCGCFTMASTPRFIQRRLAHEALIQTHGLIHISLKYASSYSPVVAKPLTSKIIKDTMNLIKSDVLKNELLHREAITYNENAGCFDSGTQIMKD